MFLLFLVFMYISCASIHRPLPDDEKSNYIVLGLVRTNFRTSFGSIITTTLPTKKTKEIAYTLLRQEAAKNFHGEFDIKNIIVSFSGGIFTTIFSIPWVASGEIVTRNVHHSQHQTHSNILFINSINRVSQELINNLPDNTRLAVINISSNNINLSANIVEELEFHLVSSRKFTIVDRNALNIIRIEQNFHMSGEVSDTSAVSIGQILGANIVITGSITETGRNQRLNIRALDVRTAEIITIVRADL